MKTIKLQGGLGNQLFQYAYGRSLELAGEKVLFDTSFFVKSRASGDTARDFKLDHFNIKTNAVFSDKKQYLRDFITKIKNRLGLRTEMYFQNENYFSAAHEEIRKEFTLKNPLRKGAREAEQKIITSNCSVCLHIRRGDYVTDKKTSHHHGTCDLDYYKRALDIIKEKTSKDFDVFVFSDDPAWAEANLHLSQKTYIVSCPAIQDYEELSIMSKCHHNIIANSTFSWWGAWLNRNPNKIVIAPKQWFKNKTSDEIGILPKGWLQI